MDIYREALSDSSVADVQMAYDISRRHSISQELYIACLFLCCWFVSVFLVYFYIALLFVCG